jgi:protein AaeX
VRLAEINVFGVYVAPIFLMMIATWLITIVLRRSASRSGLLRYVWHPPPFSFSVDIMLHRTSRACSHPGELRGTYRSRLLLRRGDE